MKKNMMRKCLVICILSGFSLILNSQEFIPIWTAGKMPNSKGILVQDSIANERVYQVGTPGVYVFEPSVAENKHAGVLIIPGGGYARLAYQISGFQLAKWFNTIGITAFVLNHRLPHSPDLSEPYKAPVQDAQRALKFIRSNAVKWSLDKNKIGAMGSSAGGHLAACVSTFSEDWSVTGENLDTLRFHPDFTILISPVISMNKFTHQGSSDNLLGKDASQEQKDLFSCEMRVAADTPPAFIIHATDDKSVSSMNSILYYSALKEKGVKNSTLHIFPQGGHSIALRNNPGSTNSWTVLLEQWLSEIGIVE